MSGALPRWAIRYAGKLIGWEHAASREDALGAVRARNPHHLAESFTAHSRGDQ
jgi:hypothetical protein